MKQLQHILIAITAILLIGACSGESYPGITYVYPESEDVTNHESGRVPDLGIPVKVFLRPQSFFSISSTRGSGPLDVPSQNRADSNRYEKSLFYIYAFRHASDDQGFAPADLTKRSGDVKDAQANCLVDGPTYPYGMPALLAYDRSGEMKMKALTPFVRDTTLHYSYYYQDIGYNFFAYYLDDAAIKEEHRTQENITFDFELDGSQDIMYGHAPHLSPSVLNEQYANIQLTAEQRYHVLNTGDYSSFASHVGIDPIIDLNHGLTRIQFLAYPGDRSADNITITGIELESRYKGHLVAAARSLNENTLTFDDDRTYLSLKASNPDGEGTSPYLPLEKGGNTVQWEEGMSENHWSENPPTRIGGDLLLPTDSVYAMILHYSQKLHEGKNGKRNVSLYYRLPAPQTEQSLNEYTGKYMYKPGYIYNVKIGVFGLRKIEIGVTIEGQEWESGGEITIGPDDEWEDGYWD